MDEGGGNRKESKREGDSGRRREIEEMKGARGRGMKERKTDV